MIGIKKITIMNNLGARGLARQLRGAEHFSNKDRGFETFLYIIGLVIIGYQIALFLNDAHDKKYDEGRTGNKTFKTLNWVFIALYVVGFIIVLVALVGMWRHLKIGSDKHRIYLSGTLVLGIAALISIVLNSMYLGDCNLEVTHIASSPSSSGGLFPEANVPEMVKISTYANAIFLLILVVHLWYFKNKHFEGKINAGYTPLN